MFGMQTTHELKVHIEELLEEAGFSPELYIIKMHESAISVHFDDAGAVEYFRKEVESSAYQNEVIFESRREGKHHVAYLQLW